MRSDHRAATGQGDPFRAFVDTAAIACSWVDDGVSETMERGIQLHAVGRDHRKWYEQQRPALFGEVLGAAKKRLDPKGILNPGVVAG